MSPTLWLCSFVLLGGALAAQDLGKALSFHASFDKGLDADFARGDRRIYTAPNYKAQAEAKPGLDHTDVGLLEGQGRFGGALQFRKKNVKAVFYQADKNVAFRPDGWNGTISFWLNLDPDQDLEPGFCDPIQVTDKAFNDSAIWVDFTRDEKPRHFRLGVFGDLKAWNPNNVPADKSPDFAKRLITVAKPPFRRGTWTHVVITHTGLGGGKGTAKLYLDAKVQGTTETIGEVFRWDLTRGALRVGVSYVGLFDELAVFDRALSDQEVARLHGLKRGVAEIKR